MSPTPALHRSPALTTRPCFCGRSVRPRPSAEPRDVCTYRFRLLVPILWDKHCVLVLLSSLCLDKSHAIGSSAHARWGGHSERGVLFPVCRR